jgi:hypothetical protein
MESAIHKSKIVKHLKLNTFTKKSKYQINIYIILKDCQLTEE